MSNRNYGILMSLGLAGIVIGIWTEISVLWTVEQNWTKLLSLTGTIDDQPLSPAFVSRPVFPADGFVAY